jgi:cytochrome c5
MGFLFIQNTIKYSYNLNHDHPTKGDRMKKITILIVLALSMLALIAVAYAAERSGEEIYNKKCGMCHNSGMAGAPKIGDAKWTSLEKGMGLEGLLKSAIAGKRAMPAKGLCNDCTDDELKATIKYIIDKSK